MKRTLLRALAGCALSSVACVLLAGRLCALQDPPLALDAPAPLTDEDQELWTLEGLSSAFLTDHDSTIQLVQSPVFKSGSREVHASWAVVWLDRNRWEEMTGTLDSEPLQSGVKAALDRPGQRSDEPMLFGQVPTSSLAGAARELYLEGPVEFYRKGELLASAGAIYLDLVTGLGWIGDANIELRQRIKSREYLFKAHADWMRHQPDGTLSAKDASITTCSMAVPHVHVHTGDLTLHPAAGQKEQAWQLKLKHNSIDFFDVLTLPLPPYSGALNEEFEPLFRDLSLGDSAKFGLSLGLTFGQDLGKVGEQVNRVLGGDAENYRANYRLRLSLYGSRGLLTNVGAEFDSPGNYWWRTWLGFIPDRGEDRGLIQVDQEDRATLRTWLRTRGRFFADPEQWFEIALSAQSDAAVQSEFFEDEFLRYEQSDNYLHWRWARDQYYAGASASFRIDDFRSATEELPALEFYRGQTQIARVGEVPILYGFNFETAYLRRLEGNPLYLSPFEEPTPYADGFGERSVLRADTSQRVEAPIALGVLALRLKPFLELRGTVWNDDTTQEDAPTRSAAFLGSRLATTFWRQGQSSALSFSPYTQFSRDLFVEESGGVPVSFDQLETPLGGERLDLGLYSRLLLDQGPTNFDLDLSVSHVSDAPAPLDTGWEPLRALAWFGTTLGGVPIGLTHEGRYDTEGASKVPYSRSSLGFDPTEDWGVEISHQRGLDSAGDPLFEAVSLSTRYRWTPKWELEGAQEFSLLDQGTLRTKGLLRRIGHDLLFEIDLSQRSGEGGPSFSINVRPLVGWKSSRIGVIDPWSL